MEAAEALAGSAAGNRRAALRDWVARPLERLLDRRRALAAGRRPALRDPRRPVLPPRRDRHRAAHPRRRLLPRDGRGQLQRVGAASLLRAGLALDPGDRDRRIRPALALGGCRGGDRAGRLPVRARAARTARRLRRSRPRGVNPMLLWYSQEARAYSLFALLCAVSALYFVRALRRGQGSDVTAWGIASALALATHYFAIFPVAVEAIWLLRRRGRGAAAAGLAIVAGIGLALAPLAMHQTSTGHAQWIADDALLHRLWETADDLLRRRDRRDHRPRRQPAAGGRALCPRRRGLASDRAARETRGAAGGGDPTRPRAAPPSACRWPWRWSRRARTTSSPAT